MKKLSLAVVLLVIVGCSDPQPKSSYPSGGIPLGRFSRCSYSLQEPASFPTEHLFRVITTQKGGPFNDVDESGNTFTVKGFPHGKVNGWCYLQLNKIWIEQPDGTYQGWIVVEE